MTSRRSFLRGGCAAAAALSAPRVAGAWPDRSAAPRVACPHRGCRNFRPVEDTLAEGGICAMSLGATTIVTEESLR